MGNHELNAIAYTFNKSFPLRPHSEKNKRQHKSFIEAFGVGTCSAKKWTDWFPFNFSTLERVRGFEIGTCLLVRTTNKDCKRRRPDGYLSEDLLRYQVKAPILAKQLK